ncbi:MAG: hypothetical protein Q4E18_04230 [Clostridia bacterium]|nr:hypothetical protein [Clostridia bacterium]
MHHALLSFRCAQDKDIETFLCSKAIEFSDRGLCSVYLLLNEELFAAGHLRIEAYFTLSHKSLIADNGKMSRSSIKRYGGFVDARTLDFVLIGQLGKLVIENEDGTYSRSPVTGKEILDYAFEVIGAASSLIPCKYALVECSDDQKVRAVYERYGFKFFQKDGQHNQYCKRID